MNGQISNTSVRPGDRGPGMSMIVRTVTRWLKGPILLFGIYIVLYGHITPGGGFGGGVIIACAFILIMLATGERNGQGVFSKSVASKLDSLGLLIFLAVGWLGTWLRMATRAPVIFASVSPRSISPFPGRLPLLPPLTKSKM